MREWQDKSGALLPGDARPATRRRDVAASRKAVLDAAETLFAARGYDATSLQEVCDAAGVSRGLPGYLFGSKEGLYRAVLDRFRDAPLRLIREARERSAEAGGGGSEALSSAIDAYFDFLLANPNFVRLIEWDALYGGRLTGEHEGVMLALREALSALSEGFGFGRLDEMEAGQLLTSIVALLWFPIVHAGTFLEPLGMQAASSEFIAERRRHVKELILAGLRARAATADP